MTTRNNDLVSSYLSWLKESIKAVELESGIIEISTPFLDRHNDHLHIYVKKTENGVLRLTDDGYILSDLEMSGCAIDTPARRAAMRQIINGYGVSENKGELFVEATLASFPHKKHAMLQAMMNVNDMFLTAKPHVANFFFEDVLNFLERNEVRFSPTVDFTGRSGFVHKFDFVIPKSRSRPERLIKTLNTPTKQMAESLMFEWTDTKDVRPPDSQLLAFVNDADKEPSGDVLLAFDKYDIKPLFWTRRDSYAEELAA